MKVFFFFFFSSIGSEKSSLKQTFSGNQRYFSAAHKLKTSKVVIFSEVLLKGALIPHSKNPNKVIFDFRIITICITFEAPISALQGKLQMRATHKKI